MYPKGNEPKDNDKVMMQERNRIACGLSLSRQEKMGSSEKARKSTA